MAPGLWVWSVEYPDWRPGVGWGPSVWSTYVESGGEVAECPAGTLVVFEPGESHAVKALEDSHLLLILAPWPAPGHDLASEGDRAEHLPANAAVDPLPPD